MNRRLYSLLIFLLQPWAVFHLLWRSRRQPAYRRHVMERFGYFGERIAFPVIWIHAVSVGETRAAEPLVMALQARHPGHRILLTHATPTGRQTGIELFGDSVNRSYLPYDLPGAVRRFLRHFEPEVGIFIETEIWPNLIEACHRRRLPVYLVNARMSEKSARGYARFGGLTRSALRQLSGIAAQSGRDAERLVSLGAESVAITGNVKFDRSVPPHMLETGARLRALFGERRQVFLAASTREGEEALILDAVRRAGLPAALLVVIVPRHPQRFDEVAQLLSRRHVPFLRRSDNAPVDAGTQVVLGDSMGELFAYYAACDVAFVGGSLLPLGGQNLLEACAVGRPVLVGPHTFNFEEATEGAVAAGAAIRARDAQELCTLLKSLLSDSGRREEMAGAGRHFAEQHRGATARTLALLEWTPRSRSGG